MIDSCGAGSFGEYSPHDDASSSYHPDSLTGHIFPEGQQSGLQQTNSTSISGPHATSAGREGPSSMRELGSSSNSHQRHPKSHPIQVTSEDIEHSLSEMELGLFSPAAEGSSTSSWQASQASMQPPRQQHAAARKANSRKPSFSAAQTGKTGDIAPSLKSDLAHFRS